MELLNFTPVPTRARHDGGTAADQRELERVDPRRYYEHSQTFALSAGLRARPLVR